MFVAPPLPAGFLAEEKDRLAWQAKVVAYVQAQGLDGLRCARRIDGANGAKSFFVLRPGANVRPHLFTISPSEIVFDLGDIVAGDPPTGNWARCRRESHAIAWACTVLGIPFICGLSGGKGIHLTISLPPEGPQSRCRDEGGDWRKFIAAKVVAKAKEFLWPDEEDRWHNHLTFDTLCIAPNVGSRLLTAYGERKSPLAPHRKVVWHEGPGPMPDLPETREAAYAICERRGSIRPTSIPIAVSAEVNDTRWVYELTGKPCPQGPACLDNERWGCDDCPALE